jgi:hypothetical protein
LAQEAHDGCAEGFLILTLLFFQDPQAYEAVDFRYV